MSMPGAAAHSRAAWRQRLTAEREAWLAGHSGAPAALAAALGDVLVQLEPAVLGVYWAIRDEFNASASIAGDKRFATLPLALPHATREPLAMQYRRWDGREPTARDECGIPTSSGAVVQPDVVLVPCVGFGRSGFRLGYGGGYFDRWIAAHAGVTTVGISWSMAELPDGALPAEPHDRALDLIVTDRGVFSA